MVLSLGDIGYCFEQALFANTKYLGVRRSIVKCATVATVNLPVTVSFPCKFSNLQEKVDE